MRRPRVEPASRYEGSAGPLVRPIDEKSSEEGVGDNSLKPGESADHNE